MKNVDITNFASYIRNALIILKDKRGSHVTAVVPELFPLTMEVVTKKGLKRYTIHLHYDGEDRIKSSTMT